MQNTLIVIHVIISVILIAVVLLQHGKQQGLSGAIAGGAETFFGKNKGRTLDALLGKVTAVVAILFVVSAIVLALVSVKGTGTDAAAETPTETVEVAPTDGAAVETEPVVENVEVEGAEAETEVEADTEAETEAAPQE